MYLRSVGTKLWDRPNKESMNPPTQGWLAWWLVAVQDVGREGSAQCTAGKNKHTSDF